MLRRLPLVLLLSLALTACDSDDPGVEFSDGGGYDDVGVEVDVAEINSLVKVAYIGRFEDGSIFDESEEAVFPLNQTIPGFRNNVAGMRVGETKTFTVPPEEGYGSNPPAGIPANATLIFEVTLLGARRV